MNCIEDEMAFWGFLVIEQLSNANGKDVLSDLFSQNATIR